MPHYIVLASSKGGTGKSTLCKQISIELIRLGYRVYGADYDPQQHFNKHVLKAKHVYHEVEATADYVVVDTVGVMAEVNISIFTSLSSESVTFIVPFLLSYDEVKEAIRMIRFMKKSGLTDKVLLVINKAYREHDKDIAKYSRHLRKVIKVARSPLTNLKAYTKQPNHKVRNQISRLLHEEIFYASAK